MKSLVLEQPEVRARARRSSWRDAATWLAAIASIGLLVAVAFWPQTPHPPGPGPGPGLGQAGPVLQWPPGNSLDVGSKKVWGSAQPALRNQLPDFNRSTGTLGASSERRVDTWRLATVIIRSKHGIGSGALISADGWLLTNYHVVASSAQEGALVGRPAVVDVITAQDVDGRVRPRAAVKSTVYRADPVHDLALLKLQQLPAGAKQLPYFQLAESVREGEDCFVVGSQYNGPAWWTRSGNVSRKFQFPDDLTEVVAGMEAPSDIVQRGRRTIIVTDVTVSGGDSGGPLLNAKGELIGLTFGSPAHSASGGAVGWHVTLEDLRRFVANQPTKPDGVPFDVWTAGLSQIDMLEPELDDADRDGSPETVKYGYVAAARETSSPELVAYTTFVDLGQRPRRPKGLADLVPSGLWGVEQGQFKFDVFMTARADQITVYGYTNRAGVVDEIRIGRSGKRDANLIWRRDAQGAWQAVRPSTKVPLVAQNRIDAAKQRRLGRIWENSW